MKILVATTSELKIRAIKSAFQNHFTDETIEIERLPANSDVSDQPMGFEETMQGALNRLSNLEGAIKEEKYDFLIGYEGGLVKSQAADEYIGIGALALKQIEDAVPKTQIITDVVFPKEMVDLIPDRYPDMGILMQEKYGAKEKDPILFLSNGKVSREDIIRRQFEYFLQDF